MANEAQATFGINLEGNVPEQSEKDAKALEGVRDAVKGAQDRIKSYNDSLRSLTGKSQEVTDAKAKLKASIDRERAAVNQGSLAILKSGTTYSKLNEKLKENRAANDNAAKAAKLVGGPLASARETLKSLKDTFTGANQTQALFAAGAALTVVAIAALAAAAVAGVVAFGRWVLAGADAARTLQLVREAATGSAQNAANLGTQVDALAKKVPTPKKELNDLAATLYRTFNNTAANGAVIVDTFNLVAQASAAMGDTVGKQLGDIVERSKRVGRIQINPLELQGTGVKFEGVASELAKNLKIGIGDAKRALFEGRVTLADGAKALRGAVEARFGEINARKMLSFEVVFEKAHESLQALTSGIKLEPLSQAVGKFFKLLDGSTVTGKTLKTLVETLGTGLVTSLVKLEPVAEKVFKSMVLGALKATIAFLKLVIYVRQIYARLEGVIGKVREFDSAVKNIPGAFSTLFGPLGTVISMLEEIVDLTGKASGANGPAATLNRDRGGSTLNGGAQGVVTLAAHGDGGMVIRPAAGEVIASVAPGESIVPAGGGGGGSRRAGPVTLELHVNVQSGTGIKGREVAKELTSPSFLAELTKAIEDLNLGMAVPVQGVPQP